MEALQKRPSVLQTVDGRKAIKNYNKLAKVFTEYEVLYQRCWISQVKFIHIKHSVSKTIKICFYKITLWTNCWRNVLFLFLGRSCQDWPLCILARQKSRNRRTLHKFWSSDLDPSEGNWMYGSHGSGNSRNCQSTMEETELFQRCFWLAHCKLCKFPPQTINPLPPLKWVVATPH